jgi:hypothetical protein
MNLNTVHHYMVDYEGANGVVRFANDVELFDLAAAKKLAKAESKKHGTAAVVAFEADPAPVLGSPTYHGVGHLMFHDGSLGDVAGVFA